MFSPILKGSLEENKPKARCARLKNGMHDSSTPQAMIIVSNSGKGILAPEFLVEDQYSFQYTRKGFGITIIKALETKTRHPLT